MAIILIYGVTKIAMIEKVHEKLRQVAGISGVEETHLTRDKGKWLVVTNKVCKNQVKKKVDRILREITLKIIAPEYNNQPGTIMKEHRNPTLVSYAAALQRETENAPTIKHVATLRQSKRLCGTIWSEQRVPDNSGKKDRTEHHPKLQQNSRATNPVYRISCLHNYHMERRITGQIRRNIV